MSLRENVSIARVAAVAVAVSVLLGSAAPPRPAAAAMSQTSLGALHLAETYGGFPNDYSLVYEASAPGSGTWSAKYLDARTDEIHAVHRDAEGVVTDGSLTDADEPGAASSALEVKADAELIAAVEAAGVDVHAQAVPDAEEAPGEDARSLAPTGGEPTIPAGVWLSVDTAAAEQAVAAAHPELVWEGGMPIVDDLATARAIRAELEAARAGVRAAAFAELRAAVEGAGGTVAYESTAAPLAYVDLPASSVGPVAELPLVSTIGLERTWTPAMSSAGPAAQADWTSGGEDQGSGVRVAVVEYHNVRNTGDLAGRVVASASTSGALAFATGEYDHPTWVAGAIASQNASFRGIAPGALIVSASTGGGGASVTRDRNIIAAADWAANAAGGDADIVNASIGQDTATGSEEARRYFDALVHEQGRLAVAAAGNLVTFGNWNIVSPGTAYNVLTVGGIDDRGSVDRHDDRMWHVPGSNGSNYRDVPGTAWNAHGDYNKPNVSAPAASVRTANGLAASGTSIASPIVAGIAAQLIARVPSLALRPEATRAIIMAGAINHSPMPDGSINADVEGTGTASALWANRVLNGGDGPWGGNRVGAMTAGQVITQDISVVAGQRVKVVVSWNSRTSGSEISSRTDRLTADLDLRVIQPDGSVAGSYTFDNNYEWVEFTAAHTGTFRIQVNARRFEASAERFGLAWAKWSVGTPIRLAGGDRYGTAAAISRAHFNPNVPVAYVATGRNFPDALAGVPAAGAQGGPILLTDQAALPQATRNELARLQPQRIIVLGGPSVVSDGVAGELQAFTARPVVRLSGPTRYETAAAISRATFGSGAPVAFIATGELFPDALAAGPGAIAAGGPVLLSRRDALPQATRDELARLRPAAIYIVGGPSVVSDQVAAELNAYAPGRVGRFAGADRYATAVAVSSAIFSRPPAVYLATGTNFPDALAAGPVAGITRSPLLLVQDSRVPPVVGGELQRLEPPRCFLNGGPSVIGDNVAAYLTALLGRP
jgi:hypothetical protein